MSPGSAVTVHDGVPSEPLWRGRHPERRDVQSMSGIAGRLRRGEIGVLLAVDDREGLVMGPSGVGWAWLIDLLATGAARCP